MEKDTAKYVKVERLLGEQLVQKMPRCIINYIKKIIHETEINESIDFSQGAMGADFFKPGLEYLDIAYEAHGVENLPPNDGKRYIFTCNHPLGGPEALIIGEVIRQYFGNNIRFIVNKLLTELKPLSPVFIPVDLLSNRQTRYLSINIDNLFQSDSQICLFPAGTCAKKIKGKITEMPWKKMFVTRAKVSQRDVIPVHCTGHNSNWYYFLSNVSRFFGMKMNLGMFYLVDELFKNKHKTFTVTFGKPIAWQTFDIAKTDVQWANEVREKVLTLDKMNVTV